MDIDVIGDDLLHNIVTTSFAYAACVNRSWNVICERVLSRPKLSSLNSSFHIAVEEVVNKVLSEPIRPHFAIVSVGGLYDHETDVVKEAHHLRITKALASQVPVITNSPRGIIARDALSDEFKKVEFVFPYKPNGIMLTVGFLPGLKVTAISLSKQIEEPKMVMIDKFITDIREFSNSVSGSSSPAAIIMFCGYSNCMISILEKMDYAMASETVIVGDNIHQYRCTNDAKFGTSAAAALVFAVDRNKPPGIGETQFHAVLASGLSPVGPTYKATFIIDKGYSTLIAARREGTHENIGAATILNQVYDEVGSESRDLYIEVTKERKYSIDREKAGCMTSLAFYSIHGTEMGYLYVNGNGIKTGDTFRFYHENSTAALSSLAAVSSHLRSFNNTTTSAGDKREVFGGLVFSCGEEYASSDPSIYVAPLLDSCPGVTRGRTFCSWLIGRGVSAPYVKKSLEQKAVRCCVHMCNAAYLIMFYTP
ncbi:F-box/LRR-repeat protein At5g63520-like [Bidens hawaiensis]|uniref:F-box/LRR-repeat protein At5g63520-like n=1 Tax=Bidens hawaiensis TaxID=980011 RepID=UPI00404969E3